MRRQLGPNPRQIENASNGAHQVIVRHDLFEIKRIEQLPLIPADPPQHNPPPLMFAPARRNHCSPATSNDFCNKIGHFRKSVATSSIGIAESTKPRPRDHDAVPTAILRGVESSVGGGDQVLYRFMNAIRKRRAKAR